MKKIFIAAAISISCAGFSQSKRVIKLPELQAMISNKSENIHVINFWATWCGPCIQELPFFEKITTESRPDVRVTLVSMDLDLDPNPDKVYKFIARKKLKSEVLLLDEDDPNSWIEKIDSNWSGALPATLIINHKSGKRIFIGKSLHEGDLERYLNEIQ